MEKGRQQAAESWNVIWNEAITKADGRNTEKARLMKSEIQFRMSQLAKGQQDQHAFRHPPSKAGMWHGINQINQNWGLAEAGMCLRISTKRARGKLCTKPECPLESTNVFLLYAKKSAKMTPAEGYIRGPD